MSIRTSMTMSTIMIMNMRMNMPLATTTMLTRAKRQP